jgi:hypothetical protein
VPVPAEWIGNFQLRAPVRFTVGNEKRSDERGHAQKVVRRVQQRHWCAAEQRREHGDPRRARARAGVPVHQLRPRMVASLRRPLPHLWATSSAGGLPSPPPPPCRATSPRRPASPRPPGRASCHAGAGVTCCTCRTRARTRWRGTITTTWRVPRRVPPVHTVPDSGVPGGAPRLVGRARVWNLVAAGMVPRRGWGPTRGGSSTTSASVGTMATRQWEEEARKAMSRLVLPPGGRAARRALYCSMIGPFFCDVIWHPDLVLVHQRRRCRLPALRLLASASPSGCPEC